MEFPRLYSKYGPGVQNLEWSIFSSLFSLFYILTLTTFCSFQNGLFMNKDMPRKKKKNLEYVKLK